MFLVNGSTKISNKPVLQTFARMFSLIGKKISEVETPALLIDLDKLDRNLAKLPKSMGKFPGVAVRPHGKAHKCPTIAHLQVRLWSKVRSKPEAKKKKKEIFFYRDSKLLIFPLIGPLDTDFMCTPYVHFGFSFVESGIVCKLKDPYLLPPPSLP